MQGDRLLVQTQHNSAPLSPSIELYEFDPANGTALLAHTFEGLLGQYWGGEFSPNGQHLFILRQESVLPQGSTSPIWQHTIYQYDLLEADIEASRVVVATQDYFLGGTAPSENNMCLAPDGRIFLNRFPVSAFAVIESPDEPAPDCGYLENGLLLDGCIMAVPHPMKYYHDDLGLSMPSVEVNSPRVWPNPVDDHGSLSWPSTGQVELCWLDIQGRVVHRAQVAPSDGRIALDVSALPPGAYTLLAQGLQNQPPWAVMVMVAR